MSPQQTTSLPAPTVPLTPEAVTPAVATSDIQCAACGVRNPSDSKFCRGCGHLLRAVPADDATKSAPEANAEGAGDEPSLTSPAEIDARRARQLLDRALILSDKGDLGAALLACRQAAALDPTHAPPYSLMGVLLERNGDLRGAVAAYEKVLQMTPESVAERDSLKRLQDRLAKAPAFNFNADELFAPNDEAPMPAATVTMPAERAAGVEARLPPTSAALAAELTAANSAAPTATALPAPAPVASAPSTGPSFFEFPAPATSKKASGVTPLAAALDADLLARAGAAAAGAPVAATMPASPTGVPKIERREVNVPVAVERRKPQAPLRAAPAPAGRTPLSPAGTPLNFSFTPDTPIKVPIWAQMLRGPSFFGRTLPLVAVAVVGLGFLGWARSKAVAIDAAHPAANTIDVTAPDNSGNIAVSVNPATPNLAPNTQTVPAPASNTGGVPVTNATPLPTTASVASANPVSAPASNGSNTPNGGGPRTARAPGKSRSNGGSTDPAFPNPIAPAAVPPASAGSGAGGGGPLILPPPQTSSGGSAQPVVQVGGNGLNPAGSTQGGRIRITQGSIVGGTAPARSGTAARSAERDAATAAANGRQDRAINDLTTAINAPGADQGYLLQQRAMAFMGRGDASRAVEDFNAAIAAYQSQIDRGEGVPAAKAGIRSARAGLNAAMSRG